MSLSMESSPAVESTMKTLPPRDGPGPRRGPASSSVGTLTDALGGAAAGELPGGPFLVTADARKHDEGRPEHGGLSKSQPTASRRVSLALDVMAGG
jgi:hypothetical protein